MIPRARATPTTPGVTVVWSFEGDRFGIMVGHDVEYE